MFSNIYEIMDAENPCRGCFVPRNDGKIKRIKRIKLEDFLQSIDTLTIHFALAAVLLPLLAFMINFFRFLKKWNKGSGWVSNHSDPDKHRSFGFYFVFAKVWNANHLVHQQLLWFTIGDTKVYGGILLNNLSALMLLLVNLIALPVHIYSTAYMKDDENKSRYFAYLSFFCFSMLTLVVVDDLVLFYIFWELVGFSSYLLIGFWFTRDKAVQANKKAFINEQGRGYRVVNCNHNSLCRNIILLAVLTSFYGIQKTL